MSAISWQIHRAYDALPHTINTAAHLQERTMSAISWQIHRAYDALPHTINAAAHLQERTLSASLCKIITPAIFLIPQPDTQTGTPF